MSAAATTREYVMQNPGVTLHEIREALPEHHPKTVRRALEFCAESGYLRRDGERYYPPASFPSRYFIDQVLVMMRRSETTWNAVPNMAVRVPVAPKILTEALRAVSDYGLVELSDDGQYAKLTEKGRARCRLTLSSREVTRLWKPPRSLMR